MSSLSRDVDPIVAQAYSLRSVIGKGSFGTVWLGVESSGEAGGEVAVKRIDNAFENVADAKSTYREIVLLTKLKHKNVVALLDVLVGGGSPPRDVYLVFELLDTDLHAVIRANILQEEHRRFVAWQLLAALKYLHSARVVHRDVKPSNVLVDAKARIRLCDFGCARVLDDNPGPDQQLSSRRMSPLVGALWYRAPELLIEAESHDAAVDIWSAGCVLGELFLGRRLLSAHDARSQFVAQWHLADASFDDGAAAWLAAVSAGALLDDAKSDQPTVAVMLADCAPDISSMISCMLRFAPADRLTAVDLLACVALQRFHNEAREPVAPAPVQMPLREYGKYRAVDYRGAVLRNVIDKINLARNRAALDSNNDADSSATASTTTSLPASPVASAAAAAAAADDASSSHEPTPSEIADAERPHKSKKSSGKHKRASGKPARRPSKLASAATVAADGEDAADAVGDASPPHTPSTPTSQSPRQLLEESLSTSQKKALTRGVLLGVQRTVTSPRQTVKQRLTPFEELQVQLEELQVKRVLLEENVEQLERTYGSGAKTREQLEVLMALGLQIGDIKEQISATEVRIKLFEATMAQEAAESGGNGSPAAAAAAAAASPAKSSPTLKKRHIPEQTKRLSRQMDQYRPLFAAPDVNAAATDSASSDGGSGAAAKAHSAASSPQPAVGKIKVAAAQAQVAAAAAASEAKPIEREKASPRTLSALAKIEEATRDIALKKSQSSRSPSTTSESVASGAEWAISPRRESDER